MTKIICATLLLITIAILQTTAYASPIGLWQTVDKQGKVKIQPCGNSYCGVLVKVTPSNAKDIHNKNRSKRSRRLKGVQLFKVAKTDSKKNWQGKLYNPRDGETYTGKLILENNNKLFLKGCILGGLLCQGEAWLRIK